MYLLEVLSLRFTQRTMAAPAVADSVKDSPPLGAHAWMYLALWMVLGYAMVCLIVI